MSATPDEAGVWDLLLRGAVGGLLFFHLVHLALPGPRPAARAALGIFTLSLVAYLVCQRGGLILALPWPLAVATLALCTSSTAWLWLSARALFDDHFAPTRPVLGAALGLVVLGLAANLPRLEAAFAGSPVPDRTALKHLHAVAMVGFTGAALWEVWRGWRDDLVAPRRLVRRWAALGIGLYAAVALAVELAVRDRPVGPWLPALHVLGIGAVTLALAVLVARRSLTDILGPGAAEPEPDARPGPEPATAVETAASVPPRGGPAPTRTASPATQRLIRAMAEDHAYRREGLTVADLARLLDLGEAPLRHLINQELGYRNFNDFLHHYRLQEAAVRLAGVEDLPILTIALECGYGSIGPFNRAFRHRFGMTPTEYRAAARMQRHRLGAGA